MKSAFETNKAFFSILLLSFLSASFAFGAAPSPGDEYSNPTPGATDPKEVIAKDAANLACQDSLCTLFAVTINKQTFTISSYIGTGSQMMQGGASGGVNNYYGYTPTSQTNNGQLGYGLQITWDNTHCTKNVNVDKSVYESVTTYMRDLINTKPGESATYPQFTPAEQTMLLFYTTVMELTKGTTCN